MLVGHRPVIDAVYFLVEVLEAMHFDVFGRGQNRNLPGLLGCVLNLRRICGGTALGDSLQKDLFLAVFAFFLTFLVDFFHLFGFLGLNFFLLV
jgi:hypothetical protein